LSIDSLVGFSQTRAFSKKQKALEHGRLGLSFE
jgi:hypothetical protein